MSLRQRNEEIIQKRKAGKSYRAISSEFGLSPGRIQQIFQKSVFEEKCQEQSAKLCRKIKMFDQVKKNWPTEILINGMQFPWKARKCLKQHFCFSKAEEISLKDIMDFLIPNFEEIPDDFYEACPAFKQKHLGHKTYKALIKFFSEQDLGHAFNIEWKNRLRNLIRFLKGSGHYIPDSFLQFESTE